MKRKIGWIYGAEERIVVMIHAGTCICAVVGRVILVSGGRAIVCGAVE